MVKLLQKYPSQDSLSLFLSLSLSLSLYLLQVETALMYDAVFAFAHGLEAMDAGVNLKTVNLSCEEEQAWGYGLFLLRDLSHVR